MLSNSKMYPEFLTLFSNEKMVYFLFLGSFLVLNVVFLLLRKETGKKRQRFANVLTKKECLVIKIQFDTHSIFFYCAVGNSSGTKN